MKVVIEWNDVNSGRENISNSQNNNNNEEMVIENGVQVIGSFNQWTEKIALREKSEGRWEVELDIAPEHSTLEFHFVINGVVKISSAYEVRTHDSTSVNVLSLHSSGDNERKDTKDWQPPQPLKTEEDNRLTESSGRKFLTSSLNEFLTSSSNFVQCPNPSCGVFFEVAGPGEELRQLSAGLEEMSEEAKEHWRSFRFRCRECFDDFCSACSQRPYHTGYTCQSYSSFLNAIKCRFCEVPLVDHPPINYSSYSNFTMVDDFCSECEVYAKRCRLGVHSACKHPYTSEKMNVPIEACRRPTCAKKGEQTDEDDCAICYTKIRSQPWVYSRNCPHLFHHTCILSQLKREWDVSISFGYMECPTCCAYLDIPFSNFNEAKLFQKFQLLKTDLEFRVKEQLLYEKIDIPPDVSDKSAALLRFAFSKLNYYICYKCKSPYYGGKKECGEQNNVPKESLVCAGCRGGCSKHEGSDIVFKCRFCCSVGQWFCFGHTHFCDECHKRPWDIVTGDGNQFIQAKLPICPGKDKCPLGVEHPPNGEEFPLYCIVCEAEKKKKAEEESSPPSS